MLSRSGVAVFSRLTRSSQSWNLHKLPSLAVKDRSFRIHSFRSFSITRQRLETPSPLSPHPSPPRRYSPLLIFFASASLFFFISGSTSLEAEAVDEGQDDSIGDCDEQDPKSRKIRLSEVKEHGPKSERPWVTRGNNVYDITDWIEGHPGGEVILRAAGGSIDPYWKIFSIHQKQEVYDILDMYLIGTIHPSDLINGSLPTDSIDDPFTNDPMRDCSLKQHTSRPCNAETPGSQLSTFITPNHIFYVRNHMWVPYPPPDSGLTIELPDGEEVIYSLEDLKTKFPQHTITSTLQCSGNRRSHMTTACTHTSGLQWKVGAIGTATWTGPFLRDILLSSGFPITAPPHDARHVQFLGHEAYGSSIPIEKALSPSGDVMLAHSMNHEPIPPDHGFPLRVIVPGHVAARSVKWLSKITISDEESTSQWQRRDYKSFGPNEMGMEDWSKAKSIQEMPVNSAVTSISPQDDGRFVVKGWAYSGGGREIVRVDVSTNNGKTWDQARLTGSDESEHSSKGVESKDEVDGCKHSAQGRNSRHWAWKQWSYTIKPATTAPKATKTSESSAATKDSAGNDGKIEGKKSKMVIVVKATDEGYNTQPERFEPIYNVRGNLAVAWHRVPISAEKLEARKTKGGDI